MRKILAAAAALVTAISLSGCSLTPSSRALEPGVDSSLAAFYTQPISWRNCDGFECAEVEVPMDWSNPSGDTIEISVIRHSAPNAVGNILLNPGGPGASGVDFVRDQFDSIGTDKLRSSFNFIGFDPRGTGSSSPVKCLNAKGLDNFLYGVSPYETGTKEDLAWSKKSVKKFIDGCKKNTGPVLEFLDTQSAARDMDVIRAYLQDDKLDYLGFSYGTFLGTTYATLFPEKVGRFVLDGAENPMVTDAEKSYNQLLGFELAMKNYVTDCLKKTGCPLSGTPSHALDQIEAWLIHLEENPLPTESGRELNIAGAVTALILAMYSEDYWQYLTQGLVEAKSGSGDTLLRLADFYNDRQDDGTYATNILEANISISCLDSRQPADLASMEAENEKLLKAGRVFGRYWLYGGTMCGEWPYPVAPAPASYAAEGAPTIVVIGTTGDPATPYQQAVALAHDVLADGFLITYKGEGHTAYGRSNDCVNDPVDQFFLTGKLPSAEPVC